MDEEVWSYNGYRGNFNGTEIHALPHCRPIGRALGLTHFNLFTGHDNNLQHQQQQQQQQQQ
jgi:hypothetical protein